MQTRVEREIAITMSPAELRALADMMEREYPRRKQGESTFLCFLYGEEGLKVSLNIDMTWLPDQTNEPKAPAKKRVAKKKAAKKKAVKENRVVARNIANLARTGPG